MIRISEHTAQLARTRVFRAEQRAFQDGSKGLPVVDVAERQRLASVWCALRGISAGAASREYARAEEGLPHNPTLAYQWCRGLLHAMLR